MTAKSPQSLEEKLQSFVSPVEMLRGGRSVCVSKRRTQIMKKTGLVEEIRYAILLAITTIGFPSRCRALTWVNDVVEQ